MPTYAQRIPHDEYEEKAKEGYAGKREVSDALGDVWWMSSRRGTTVLVFGFIEGNLSTFAHDQGRQAA